jgi:nucleoside-diphosphate-sugar epimerase
MKIFMTGSSGFVGEHLVERLLSLKNEVTGYDIQESHISDDMFEHVTGDVSDREHISNVLSEKKYDLIIHLAAKHHDFGIEEKEYFFVNEGGTKNICDAAAKYKVKKIIFVSSVAVYGSSNGPIYDDDPCKPESFYGKSKLAAEKKVEEWFGRDNSRAGYTIRPAVIFGPHNYANMYHLINKVLSKKFVFIGDGSNIKSIAYVSNLVNAILFLINHLKESEYDVFNYSDEPQLTISQIVEKIAEYGKVNFPKLKFPLSVALCLLWPLDIIQKVTGKLIPITANRVKKFNTPTHFESQKIRKLGYSQDVNLDKAFKETIDWIKSN